ncbi:MAG: DUF3783 domain-containing protein [Verrucomicrobia bacterium]|jgi:hypothetical protein|nr:DUF3783 domain-containing protein [Verrucomicrobiota bacterium]
MARADSTFQPVGDSDARLHGVPAVLVSGFKAEEQVAFRGLMDSSGLEMVPTVYIVEVFLERSLAELTGMPSETRAGETAELPRAIVMSGLSEKQLHALMDGYRGSGLPRPHWGSVTPTNESWSIKRLLIELLKESEALRQARAAE